jgi:hypothetical protein
MTSHEAYKWQLIMLWYHGKPRTWLERRLVGTAKLLSN